MTKPCNVSWEHCSWSLASERRSTAPTGAKSVAPRRISSSASSKRSNILERQFQAHNPNKKWVTDVTEFNVGGKKLYLSPVMNLYNGEIVSYEIAKGPLFDRVASMLGKA